jgi:pyruvate/2-oxoglutarate dehydrogenase complex dihydrolipoamide acyltransferase (E2) component
LGALGVRSCTTLIRPPQTAALAVGGIQTTAVEVNGGDGVVRFTSHLTATLCYDVRAIDELTAQVFLF